MSASQSDHNPLNFYLSTEHNSIFFVFEWRSSINPFYCIKVNISPIVLICAINWAIGALNSNRSLYSCRLINLINIKLNSLYVFLRLKWNNCDSIEKLKDSRFERTEYAHKNHIFIYTFQSLFEIIFIFLFCIICIDS